MATSPLNTAGLQYDPYSKQWGTYSSVMRGDQSTDSFTPAASQPTTVAGFDPTALGLSAHMVGVQSASDATDPSAGAQSGWFKSMGGGQTQQYDMAGNNLGITQDKSAWESIMPIIGIAALALTGGALAGLAEGVGTGVAVGTAEGVSAEAFDTMLMDSVAQSAAATAATATEAAALPSIAAATDAAGVVSSAALDANLVADAATINEAAAGAAGATGSGAAPTIFNAAADSQAANAALGLDAYAGSVPTAVDLGSAGGIQATGAVNGVADSTARAFNPAVDSQAANAAGNLPPVTDPTGAAVPTGTTLPGASTVPGSTYTPTLGDATKAASVVKAVTGGGGGGGGGGSIVDNILGGTNNAQLLATLASLYSGNKVGDAISAAADKLTQGITDSKGQLLTSKTEALAALKEGLIDQKAALDAGLVDANGALTKSSQDAIASVQQGAASAKTDLHGQLDPYAQAGQAALARLSAGTAQGGEFDTKFTMADATNSAAMQSAQAQGADIIQNSAAGKSGLLNVNNQADLLKFGQTNAAQFQNQAFNQWLQNRNANEQGVQNMVNTGLTAGTTLGTGLSTIDQNLGTNVANIDTNTGKAISANDMTAAANKSGAIGTYGTNVAKIDTGYGKDISDLTQTGSQIYANSILGQAKAQQDGIANAIKAYGTLGGGSNAPGSSAGGTIGSVWNAIKGIWEPSTSGGGTPDAGVVPGGVGTSGNDPVTGLPVTGNNPSAVTYPSVNSAGVIGDVNLTMPIGDPGYTIGDAGAVGNIPDLGGYAVDLPFIT